MAEDRVVAGVGGWREGVWAAEVEGLGVLWVRLIWLLFLPTLLIAL